MFGVTAVLTARRLIGHSRPDYRAYRHAVGRVILLGLEILVAADIIRSVGVAPTFHSVASWRRSSWSGRSSASRSKSSSKVVAVAQGTVVSVVQQATALRVFDAVSATRSSVGRRVSGGRAELSAWS